MQTCDCLMGVICAWFSVCACHQLQGIMLRWLRTWRPRHGVFIVGDLYAVGLQDVYTVGLQGGTSGTPYTVYSPATAKNSLSVGASVNGGSFDQVAYFSSHGPVSTDLRFKVCVALMWVL
jgi:hypothetical protein